MPPDEDAARLWDMLVYAREIAETLTSVTFAQYMADKNLRLATERRIEIIGEAARNVTMAFQTAHPEIPWQKIVAQRHVLAHEYGDIRQDMIHRVATLHIPELIKQLISLVPTPPEAAGSKANTQ